MKQIAVLLAAAVVFLAVFLLIEKEASPFFQNCISQGSGDESTKTGDKSNSSIGSVIVLYAQCSGRFTDGHGAGITALFTIILAVSTILLWVVTNKAAEAAKDAAEYIPVVEGAHVYVVIKEDEISNHLQMIGRPETDPDFTLRIRVALKNFGKTPAFVERFNARLSLVSAKKPIFGPEARIQPNTIIGAGDEVEPSLTVSAPVLSKASAEEIW